MEILTLNALSDNYMYLILDQSSKECAAVDPVDADSMLAAVNQRGLILTAILTTHHHSDHAGGNCSLVDKWKAQTGANLVVYGKGQRVEGLSKAIDHGHSIKLGDDIRIECLATPCHTQDHICYHVVRGGDTENGIVFTGDTLFLGGCGRFFEGSANEMYNALIGILSKLPLKTKVYCGHEYTVKNLEFALTIEPENKQMADRFDHVKQTRSRNEPTVPGTIEEELATNPFMRVTQADVQARLNTSDPVEAMRVIRAKKDAF